MGDITGQDIEKYIDIETALSRVRGNKVIYKKMLGMFLDSEEFVSFEEALEAVDYPRAAEVAHGIKGMTGNLGLTVLFEESTNLMLQLRQGPPNEQTLANYREALEKTKSCAQAVIEQD